MISTGNNVILEANWVWAWTSWAYMAWKLSCTIISRGFSWTTWFKSVSIDWAWANADNDEMFKKSWFPESTISEFKMSELTSVPELTMLTYILFQVFRASTFWLEPIFWYNFNSPYAESTIAKRIKCIHSFELITDINKISLIANKCINSKLSLYLIN